jgi:hypothetical protein
MEHFHLKLRKKDSRGTGRLNFTTGNLGYSIHEESVTRNGQFHIRFYEQFDAPESHVAFFISLKFGSNSSGLQYQRQKVVGTFCNCTFLCEFCLFHFPLRVGRFAAAILRRMCGFLYNRVTFLLLK